MKSSQLAKFLTAAVVVLVIIAAALAGALTHAVRRRKAVTGALAGAVSQLALAPRSLGREGVDLARPRSYEETREEFNRALLRGAAGDFCDEAPGTGLSAACADALGTADRLQGTRGSAAKRLRPVAVLEIVRALNAARPNSRAVDGMETALACEYIHTASLVVDDLPEFDNDAERRGRPTVHVGHGRNVAMMCATSMVMAGLRNVCRQAAWCRARRAPIDETACFEWVARAFGPKGASKGQYMDMSDSETFARENGADGLEKLMYFKTAVFYECAFALGWIVGGGDPAGAAGVAAAGRAFGTAFQAADDLRDMDKDREKGGQGGGGSWNFANARGEEAALDLVATNLAECRAALTKANLWSKLWGEVYSKVEALAIAPSAATIAAPASQSS